MLRKFFLAITVLISSVGYSQDLPTNFHVGSQPLYKVSDSTPASNSIERILIQGNTIWLATSDGLSKSTDNGENWTNYYKTQPFGDENVSAIGYDNGKIWAATWHIETKFGRDLPVGSGIKYSIDQGLTWSSIDQPVDLQNDTVTVYGSNSLKTVPKINGEENFVYGFAFTKNTIWIVSARGGLRKSIDNGKTWQRVLLPPDEKDSIKPTEPLNFKIDPNNIANHIAFSIYAVDDQLVYVGTQGGLNKSTDGGISWTKFTRSNQVKHIIGSNVFAINRNLQDNSIWVSSVPLDYPGVSVSYDGGENWENYLSGEQVRDFGFKYYGNPGAYTGAEVFAASGNGLFRTSNNGTTWISAPPIIDDATKTPANTNKFLSVEPQKKDDGTYSIWIGSSGAGLIRLNESNGFWSGNWKVYLTKEKVASSSETYAFPNPFSPDFESIKIVYSTSQTDNVTIRVFDFGMNLVKTVLQNAGRGMSDEQIVSWDGRNEAGRIVPNGVYFYRIDIGSGTPLFGKIMVMM